MASDTSARRQLAIGIAIAEKVRSDPERLLELARRKLAKLRSRSDARFARPWLDEWEARITAGPEAVIDVLTDPGEHGHDMRQMTPFAGALTDKERWTVLRKVYSAVG